MRGGGEGPGLMQRCCSSEAVVGWWCSGRGSREEEARGTGTGLRKEAAACCGWAAAEIKGVGRAGLDLAGEENEEGIERGW